MIILVEIKLLTRFNERYLDIDQWFLSENAIAIA